MHALVVALVIVTSAGCNNLFAVHECLGADDTSDVRDPMTGTCVEAGSELACRYCARDATCIVANLDELDYADCYPAQCDSATEATCLPRVGCFAAYVSGIFFACWRIAPAGPVHDGGCAGLDAHHCSRHDDCSMRYARLSDGTMLFDHCADEPRAGST